MKKQILILFMVLDLFLLLSLSASAEDSTLEQSEASLRAAAEAFLSGTGDSVFVVDGQLTLSSDFTVPNNFTVYISGAFAVGENAVLSVSSNGIVQIYGSFIVNGVVNNSGFMNFHGASASVLINGAFHSQGSHGSIRIWQDASIDRISGNLQGVTFDKYFPISDDDSLASAISFFQQHGTDYKDLSLR